MKPFLFLCVAVLLLCAHCSPSPEMGAQAGGSSGQAGGSSAQAGGSSGQGGGSSAGGEAGGNPNSGGQGGGAEPRCTDEQALAGTGCREQAGLHCVIAQNNQSIAVPTCVRPGTAAKGMRCTSRDGCAAGLTCAAIVVGGATTQDTRLASDGVCFSLCGILDGGFGHACPGGTCSELDIGIFGICR